jgi:uncharacterized membrane protein
MAASHSGMANLVIGLVLIGVSMPLVLRMIPMNDYYGVRLRKSFMSDENWYAINAYAGKCVIGVGALLAVIGALMLDINIQQEWLLKALSFAPVLIVLAIIATAVYSRKL